MTPGKYSLALYRGDSYKWQFILWTDTDKTVPADLTGVVPKAEIRNAPAGTVILVMTTSVTMPNKINMSITAVQCAALTTAGGVWDLQLTYAAGDVATVLAGAVTVTADITDSTGGMMLMSVKTVNTRRAS